jgi:GNAT superfamily N-acetyltransferase
MIAVRRAHAADKKSIWQVHTSAIRELCKSHYGKKEITQWLDSLRPEAYDRVLREREVFVAEKENEIVGYGQLDLQDKEIEAIYVSPTCVGQGVGMLLLERLEEVAGESGVTWLHLCSTLNAVGFYERKGYQARGNTVCRLPTGVNLSCVRMVNQLSSQIADTGRSRTSPR